MSEAYSMVSVKKKSDQAGRSSGKKMYIVLFRWEDVVKFEKDEKGVKVTGATVHFVNEIPDGGRIIMQKAVSIRDDDTPESLQKRVMRLAEWKILPAAAELVCQQMIQKREVK